MKKLLLVLCLLVPSVSLLAPSVANSAGPNIQYLITLHDQDDEGEKLIASMINNLGHGILYAHLYSKTKYGKKLICMPENLRITSSQYYSIFLKQVEKSPSKLSQPAINAGMHLMFGLAEKFPCP